MTEFQLFLLVLLVAILINLILIARRVEELCKRASLFTHKMNHLLARIELLSDVRYSRAEAADNYGRWKNTDKNWAVLNRRTEERKEFMREGDLRDCV